MYFLWLYTRLKRSLDALVRREHRLCDKLIAEQEDYLEWYANKWRLILEDLEKLEKLHGIALNAIDEQGKGMVKLEEEKREYRATIRKLERALDKALTLGQDERQHEVTEDVATVEV